MNKRNRRDRFTGNNIRSSQDFVNILIVDDNNESLRAMEMVLETPEYHIFKANSGKEALKFVLKEEFAVILLDVNMPEIDGFEIAKLLQKREISRKTPIIFVTGMHHNEFYEKEGYALGAVDYLIKPFNPEFLKAKVRVFVELSKKNHELSLKQIQLQETLEKERQAKESLKVIAKNLEIANTKLLETPQIIQAEKMIALGTMIAGVAHELNNPMMGILNFVQYCKKHTDAEDRRYDVLNDTEKEVNRCIGIVENLLTFSHFQQDGKNTFELKRCNEIIDDIFKLLKYRFEKEKVKILKEYKHNCPAIYLNINNMHQVFLNLFINALDSMMDSKRREIKVSIDWDTDFVKVSIKDTGCGVPEKNINKVFNPFFTTKSIGKGTGLGLSVCQSIIKAHRGQIQFESKEGLGSKFVVILRNKKV